MVVLGFCDGGQRLGRLQGCSDAVHEWGHERVTEICQDDADGPGAAGLETSRHEVGPIAEVVGDLHDPLACLRFHSGVFARIERSRDRRRMHTRRACDVVERHGPGPAFPGDTGVRHRGTDPSNDQPCPRWWVPRSLDRTRSPASPGGALRPRKAAVRRTIRIRASRLLELVLALSAERCNRLHSGLSPLLMSRPVRSSSLFDGPKASTRWPRERRRSVSLMKKKRGFSDIVGVTRP